MEEDKERYLLEKTQSLTDVCIEKYLLENDEALNFSELKERNQELYKTVKSLRLRYDEKEELLNVTQKNFLKLLAEFGTSLRKWAFFNLTLYLISCLLDNNVPDSLKLNSLLFFLKEPISEDFINSLNNSLELLYEKVNFSLLSLIKNFKISNSISSTLTVEERLNFIDIFIEELQKELSLLKEKNEGLSSSLQDNSGSILLEEKEFFKQQNDLEATLKRLLLKMVNNIEFMREKTKTEVPTNFSNDTHNKVEKKEEKNIINENIIETLNKLKQLYQRSDKQKELKNSLQEELKSVRMEITLMKAPTENPLESVLVNTVPIRTLHSHLLYSQYLVQNLNSVKENIQRELDFYQLLEKLFAEQHEKLLSRHPANRMVSAGLVVLNKNEQKKLFYVNEVKPKLSENSQVRSAEGSCRELLNSIDNLHKQISQLKEELSSFDHSHFDKNSCNFEVNFLDTEIENIQDAEVVEAIKLLKEAQETLQTKKNGEGVLRTELHHIIESFNSYAQQNTRLAEQLYNKDENYNLLLEQLIRSTKLQEIAAYEKETCNKKLHQLTKRIYTATNYLKLLDERTKMSTNFNLALETELNLNIQAIEVLKRKISDYTQFSSELKGLVEKISKIHDLILKDYKNKTIALEEELVLHNSIKKAVFLLNREIAELKTSGLPEDDESLEEEVKMYRDLVSCSLCKSRRKSAVLTKCFHVFCSSCIKELLETHRNRCPDCSEQFGFNDFHSILFIRYQVVYQRSFEFDS